MNVSLISLHILLDRNVVPCQVVALIKITCHQVLDLLLKYGLVEIVSVSNLDHNRIVVGQTDLKRN